VWLARNVVATLRAVKIVSRRDFSEAYPFEREFKGIQKYEPVSRSHEGLIDILQIGRNEAAGYFYYVMELADDAAANPRSETRNPKEIRNPKAEYPTVKGSIRGSDFGLRNSDFYTPRTLRTELKTRGRLPLAECIQLGLSLCRALEHLHRRGLVHRDIKPSNIIFVAGAPKLADVGLVADVGEARSYVGTEGFIPPEGPGSVQADLYSLGKVLYEMSMGRSRLDFPALPANWDELPADQHARLLEFNEVLVKACESDPRRRYRSAHEMHGDLAMLERGKSVKQKRATQQRRAVAKKAALGAAIVALLSFSAFGLFTSFSLRGTCGETRSLWGGASPQTWTRSTRTHRAATPTTRIRVRT
jgi:serine/threonine protein kinase